MQRSIVEVRLVSPHEEPIISDLLAACELPYDDISHHFQHFHVALVKGQVIGTVGIEIYQTVALLRSLALSAAFRGHGNARLLYERMESYARVKGVTALYLLTLSAAGFFAKLGFTEIERDTVPPKIGNTREFTTVCPATATCMMKRLTTS